MAYGYNTILLSNTSAAVLDVPINSTLLELQNQKHGGAVWNLSATVNAYLAVQDLSSDFRTNDTTWNSYVGKPLQNGLSGLNTICVYVGNRARLGMLPCVNNSDFFYGIYDSSSLYGGMHTFTDPFDDDVAHFR